MAPVLEANIRFTHASSVRYRADDDFAFDVDALLLQVLVYSGTP